MSEIVVSSEDLVKESHPLPSKNNIFSVVREVEAKEGVKAKITFLYCNHGKPEYFDAIWEKCQDADLILSELVGDKKERVFVEALAKVGSDANPQNPQIQRLREEYKTSAIQTESIHMFLVSRILGTKKRLETIDVNTETQEHESSQRYHKLDAEITKLVIDGHISKSVEKYPEMIDAFIEQDEIRESVVLQQLEEKLSSPRGVESNPPRGWITDYT